MRRIDAQLLARLKSKQQTRAQNAEPSAIMWISRPVTPLTDERLLERQDIATISNLSRPSVAARHALTGREADRIYIGYIADGTAKVIYAKAKPKMSDHSWTDTGLSAAAVDIAVCFDGTFKTLHRGTQEFVTETVPWVFRVTADGKLYGAKLGDDWVELASANCTAVSAVRATWSDVQGFDFGLCVFFLLEGVIYYRQLIDGEWMDAAPIGFGPAGVTYTDIAACRTWDYRVAIQAKATDGTIYELFSQFAGLGTRSAEHLDIRSVSAASELVQVNYSNTQAAEHIEVTDVDAGALYGGLYATGVPAIVSAYNIDDGTGDMGKKAVFVFDTHLVAANVAAQYAAFSIVDAGSVSYIAASAELGTDGKTVTLTFADFNNASGACQAKYTAGTVASMAGTALETVARSFTPTGLVPSAIPAPEPVEGWNE